MGEQTMGCRSSYKGMALGPAARGDGRADDGVPQLIQGLALGPAARGDGRADDGVPQLRLRPGDARLHAALLLVSQVASRRRFLHKSANSFVIAYK